MNEPDSNPFVWFVMFLAIFLIVVMLVGAGRYL